VKSCEVSHAAGQQYWGGFSLRECMVICFCSVLIVASDMFLHIPMRLPGHRVLPLAFFVLLGRFAVGRAWAGSAVGLLAGIASCSMGLHGVDQVFKFLAAGVIVDGLALMVPLVRSRLLCVLAGGLIGASWLPVSLLVNRMVGMDMDLALRLALFKTGSAVLFGAIGAAPVPTVARRLSASGLLPARTVRSISPSRSLALR